MSAALAAIITLALAWCFTAAGDLILGRRSHGLAGWVQAWLVGLSAATTAFFPLSLVLPHHALSALLMALVTAGLLGIVRAWRRRNRPEAVHLPTPREWTWWSVAFLGVIAALTVQFNVHNLRVSYFWDGYRIWATKALIFFTEGGLPRAWISGEHQRLIVYPPMVPFHEALIARVAGAFEWNMFKPLFGLFYLAMAVSTYVAARQLVSRPVALGATALLLLQPAVSSRDSVGGLSDMPQAALVAGAAAALLSLRGTAPTWRHPAPWIVGGLVVVKNEGLVHALVACAAVFAWWLLAARPSPFAWLRRAWSAVAVVAVCLALRVLFIRWVGVVDLTYGPIDAAHVARAYQHLWLIPQRCFEVLATFEEWSWFWIAFLAAAPIVLVTGGSRARALALGAVLAVSAEAAIFYFTNWDFTLHIRQAFSRLLSQIAPVAAVVIVVAYGELRGGEG